MAKYKSIDLFAGIGGIRLGFDRAFGDEISTVFVSEWDEYAQKTYKANFDDNFEIAGDITKINEKDIPQFDICLAGFPCQAFSLAGKRQGFDDNYKGLCRGTLFMDVARICEYHKPRVIFCENVKGLKIHDRGRTFEIIRKTFEDLGYKVFSEVLNSKDFGVPQNRERIYIVAFRNDIAPEEFAFPKATDDTKRIKDNAVNKKVLCITDKDFKWIDDDGKLKSFETYQNEEVSHIKKLKDRFAIENFHICTQTLGGRTFEDELLIANIDNLDTAKILFKKAICDGLEEFFDKYNFDITSWNANEKDIDGRSRKVID